MKKVKVLDALKAVGITMGIGYMMKRRPEQKRSKSKQGNKRSGQWRVKHYAGPGRLQI